MTPLHFDYPISVAILYYGGDAGDMQDTEEAVDGIEKALEKQGHMVREVEVTEKNWRKAINTPGEVVINLVEDETWELYNKVGQTLAELGRAEMGHDRRSFRYATKKAGVKRRMKKIGVATPNFRILNRRSKISQIRGLEYPLMVKPSGQHAGIGISQDSVVIDEEELWARVKYVFANFAGEVVVEEYVEGREMHVTVMGNGRHVFTLPYCELNFGGEFADNWNVYSYDAKWTKESWEYWGARVDVPGRMGKMLEDRLERLAVKAYRNMGCRDIARMDIRVDERNLPYVVDVNMNPSLNSNDDQDATLASVEALGWSYEEFIETLVAITYKRVYGRLPRMVRERHFLLGTSRL